MHLPRVDVELIIINIKKENVPCSIIVVIISRSFRNNVRRFKVYNIVYYII